MKRLVCLAAGTLFVCGPAALAQSQPWEVGVLGGFAYTAGMNAKRGNLEATPDFRPSLLFGVTGGHNMYGRLGGEINYLYRMTDARLKSGGTTATFDANVHLLTYDFLYHFGDREASVRPYLLFGGGMKLLRGSGQERANQPLGNIAVFAATKELFPVADVGFGVKWQVGRFGQFRVEARDYLSPAPNEVIAPFPGGKISGVWNDIVALVGYSFRF